MHKPIRTICCIIVFLFLCAGTFLFLNQFVTQVGNIFIFQEWQEAVRIDKEGKEIPVSIEELNSASSFASGETYILKTVLDSPENFEYLRFETSDAEITLSVDGEDVYHSEIQMPNGSISTSTADIPIQEFWNRAEITMKWTPKDTENIYLPILRMTSDKMMETSTMSYANKAAIPSGAFAIVFLLVCGIFLISVISDNPDYSLIPLAVAAGVLSMKELVITLGYYFLSDRTFTILKWHGFDFLPLIMIAVYLILNRKRSFLRYFAVIFLFTLFLFGILYTVSRQSGGYLAQLTNSAISELFLYGYYDLALYWVTVWLTLAGACISSYSFIRRMTDMQIENKTMALKNQALLDNYRHMEERKEQTTALRHEMRHHILALKAIYEKGNLSDMASFLNSLNIQSEKVMQMDFTKNIILNSILQNTAARAAKDNIRFDADVAVPEKLDITETDLCSFVMNLLDNALEACMRIDSPGKCFIHFKASLTQQGFLAIRCENSYSGLLMKDASGRIKTMKEDTSLHGFGLKQMEQIAKKYNSLLDISYTNDTFTVMTALKKKSHAL